MKRLGIGNILKWFLVICAIIVAIPPVINLVCEMLNTYTKLNFDWRVEWSSWSDLIAVAIPSALTCFVIKQSEEQQKANDESQERMERINRRMLDLEAKSSFAYFVPQINDNRIKKEIGKVVPYRHDLSEPLKLKSVGNDVALVLSETVRFNGFENAILAQKPLFIAKEDSLDVLYVDLGFENPQLIEQQVDLEIEIEMKNIRKYHYSQILYIGFEKDGDKWVINKFNMEIKEIEENAH